VKTRPKFTHISDTGQARMVDVAAKPVQYRRATASGRLKCRPATTRALLEEALPKGDALAVAQIAGIQAAKRTSELVPLCHPLPLEHVEVSFEVKRDHIAISCTVCAHARTGVEMEALAGVCGAALALYDMCKAVDRTMVIESVRVEEKIKV